tara:strand:+ start:22180 stop:23139 length:960 start_codon:yes stop_codon:yes gene_type:complete
MNTLILYLGFLFSAYAVIGNDVIQTLGTFIAANKKRPWLILWGYASTILVCTLLYGWYFYNGDVTFNRLDTIPLPEEIKWWYLLAPLSLLLLTRFGLPVSTTFLILSIFSQQAMVEKMLLKSIYGYGVAIVSSFIIYLLLTRKFESPESLNEINESKRKRQWEIAQWLSTGFLWSQWLIQDFANIFVFLPRKMTLVELMISILVLLLIMAYIFQKKGGRIQGIVDKKVNSGNIRSATFIDLTYGVILYTYGNLNSVPMSTTWAFIGVLAGRELAIKYVLNKKELKKVFRPLSIDLSKVFLGLGISVFIVFVIQWMNGSS